MMNRIMMVSVIALMGLASFPSFANDHNRVGQRMILDQRVPHDQQATKRIFTKPIVVPNVPSANDSGMAVGGFKSEEQLDREAAAEERAQKAAERKEAQENKKRGAKVDASGSSSGDANAQINVLEILDEDQSGALQGHGDPDAIDAHERESAASKDVDENEVEERE